MTIARTMKLVSPKRGFFGRWGQAQRAFSNRKDDCAEDNSPRCSPENMAKMRCDVEALRAKMASNYFNPDCCGNPCLYMNPMPRFDDLYYKVSDKRKRKYQQTWAECPELKIIPKKLCTYPVDPPRFDKRSLKKKAPKGKGSCPPMTKYGVGLLCLTLTNGKCPRLSLKNCPKSRIPPGCTKIRPPSDCHKWCAPYPSYSECIRDPLRPKRAIECDCLNFKPYCPEGSLKLPKPFKCP